MTPKEKLYYENEQKKDREELIRTIVSLRIKLDEYADYSMSNTKAIGAMHEEFMKCRKDLEEAREENRQLKETLAAVSAKEQLRVRDIFGRGTEKLADLLESNNTEELTDEAESDDVCPGNIPSGQQGNRHVKRTSHGKRSKNKVSERVNLDSLPQQSRFILDTDEFDEKYGKGNWRIAYWKNKRTIEIPRVAAYCLNTYTPVLSMGLEHTMIAAENPGILPGSFVSPSFLSYILYERLFMSLPFYRISESLKHMGVSISRQTLTGWFIRFSETHFSLIYDRFFEILMDVPYHQCDETFTRVIHDGRKSGSFSYMWVHRTSELWPKHQIILYSFELTRGTDHLRKFYDDFKGFITCDAYCSYRILGSEKADAVKVCGCMMHLRRRFAQSLSLIDKKTLSDEAIEELTETKALRMIGSIYDADEKLKDFEASERRRIRREKIKPLVDEFFTFVETLPTDDPSMSSKLKDAIGYAKNQKEYLCRFLDDGTVPIDDGATERAIRDFAISKKNSLFFNTIRGAEAAAVMYSILETSKANGVNVYIYLMYLLEEITRHLDDTDTGFIDACMPWSAEYQEYEDRNKNGSPGTSIIGETGIKPMLPKTPTKNSRPSSFGVA